MKIQFSKIRSLLLIVSSIIIFSSCLTTQSVFIEIPIHSGKELPDYIQSLTIINRTVDSSYADYNTDTLQQIFYNKKFNYDTVLYDIQSVDTTLKALGELLFESGRYDFVIPEERFLSFERNAFLTSELAPEEVKQICETYKTDAVLSLDHFKTRVSTNYTSKKILSQVLNGEYLSNYTAEMKVYYEALLRVYDPVSEKVISREFLRDTLYWGDYGPSTRLLMENFTPVKKGLTEAGIAVALDYSDKIGIAWREERRNYFPKGDLNLSQAQQFVQNGNWETALALWKTTAEKTKSKSLKSKALLNIAIAYELQGDVENAIKWALDSYNTMYRLVTYEYLEILKKRKNEIKKQQR